jgi:hypothetical protein
MNKTTLHHPTSASSLPRLRLLPALLVGVAFLTGCTAPMIHREIHIHVYQMGVNSVASDVLKEYEISPQVKGSLK